MMKKIMTILVLVMFAFSGSLAAYAQEDQARDARGDVRSDAREDKRFDRSDKINELKARGQDRKDTHKGHTDAYKRECSDKPSDAAGCVKARADVAKSFDKIIDRLLKVTRTVHGRLQESDLTDKNSLIKLTDVYQTKLLEIREDLAGDVRPDKLRGARTKLHETWVNYKLDLAHIQDSLWEERAHRLLTRAEKISTALQLASDSLKTDSSVDSARVAKIDEALVMIARDVEDVKKALQTDLRADARPALKRALHELHVSLQNVVKHFRDLGHGRVASDAVSDAVSDAA